MPNCLRLLLMLFAFQNNIPTIDERMFCEIFDGLRTNDTLVRLSAANCDINDFAGATLNLAIENNQALKSLNLESNRLSPDTLAGKKMKEF